MLSFFDYYCGKTRDKNNTEFIQMFQTAAAGNNVDETGETKPKQFSCGPQNHEMNNNMKLSRAEGKCRVG